MEKIIVLIATALFELLVTTAARWVVRKMHAEGVHEPVLRWLERAKFRRPKDALTMKEIIDHKIISAVDPEVISSEVTERIERGLANWGLIVREWDKVLRTPLKFWWKQFFVRLGSTFSEFILPNLNRQYADINVACFVVLPFPRDKKHKPIESFQQAFEACLGSQTIHQEYISTSMLDRKVAPQWLSRLGERERILVLQPMAINDQYLQNTLELINECCIGSVHEVITILDGSGRPMGSRSENPRERVLFKLNLSSEKC